LSNLLTGTPGICKFILLLIVWVHSFGKMLPSVKFAEDTVLAFVILPENAKIVQLLLSINLVQ